MSDMKSESQAQVSANMRDTIAALRAEVAALKAECAEAWRVHSEVVAELKAKLAKYTEPLTPMQADDISREFNGHGKLVMDMDAAIREVRGK